MKVALLFVLASITFTSESWLTDFDKAKAEAKETNKLILLNFSGSDWCAPCIKLDKDIFQQAGFVEYADKKLVLLRADFPRQKKHQLEEEQRKRNEKLADQYNPSGKFPLTLLLDADGKVIYTWDGFSGASLTEFLGQIDAHAAAGK